MIKVLNAYCGIGGNRKHWTDCEVTAVEMNPEIAKIYQDFFPDDKVVVGDAHQFLLDHYKEFDFIWTSPPCPSHSQVNHFLNAQGIIRYQDMALWQEIVFLKYFCVGDYCVENVKSFYDPMFNPQKRGRHFFWANFKIPHELKSLKIGRMAKLKDGQRGDDRHKLLGHGFDLSAYNGINKEHVLRNCVTPGIGEAIFNRVTERMDARTIKQTDLFTAVE